VNKRQKAINQIASVMKDVSYMKLMDDYNIIGGYDYNENSLFRLCRKELRELVKLNKFNNSDIYELIGNLYCSITSPLCEKIVQNFKSNIYQ
jgi:ADP-dependent phosphofructokinase/glucokinase